MLTPFTSSPIGTINENNTIFAMFTVVFHENVTLLKRAENICQYDSVLSKRRDRGDHVLVPTGT